MKESYAKERPAGGRWPAFTIVLGMLLALVGAPMAQASTAQQTQNAGVVTLPAGGTASITVRGFCLEFGEPFPTQDTRPRGLASDRVRAGLNYAVQRGYTDSNAAQVQQAIWFLSQDTWRSTDRTLAEEIVNNATTANAPQPVSGATSIVDAIAQNQVTVVSAMFTPQTADAFYGDGQLQIRNSGNTELRLYVPIGVEFEVPNAPQFQRLAAYALSIQAQVTASPAVTGTVTGTTTVTGTVGVATATVAVTGTATITGTVAVETPTSVATGTVALETPTTVAIETVAVETPTTLAETPTVEVATPIATDTPVAGGTLPQTGSGDNNLGVVLLVVAAAMIATGLGAILRSRLSYHR